MKTIKVIIERSEDAFWAYSENTEVNGVGDTVEEVKQSVLDCLEIQKELGNLKANEEYDIVYKFDTESLLKHYKGIFTNAAFERLTGINQLQISHYATGLKKPRPAQAKKIETALHKLGSELMAIEL
jgi:hypothetical protein